MGTAAFSKCMRADTSFSCLQWNVPIFGQKQAHQTKYIKKIIKVYDCLLLPRTKYNKIKEICGIRPSAERMTMVNSGTWPGQYNMCICSKHFIKGELTMLLSAWRLPNVLEDLPLLEAEGILIFNLNNSHKQHKINGFCGCHVQ